MGRIASQIGYRMGHIGVVESRACEVEGEVEVEFVGRAVVIVEVDAQKGVVDTPRRLLARRAGCLFVHRIGKPYRHFGQPVVVGVVEEERILPVFVEIEDAVGALVHLGECRLAVVVLVEVAEAVVIPAAKLEIMEILPKIN